MSLWFLVFCMVHSAWCTSFPSDTALPPITSKNRALGPIFRLGLPLKLARAVNHIPGSDQEYSSAWTGGVVRDKGFYSVTGTIVVPTLKVPAGSDKEAIYGGSAWVGIDGYSNNVVFQTGIAWYLFGGQPVFQSWYEWFPADPVYFTNFGVSPGDALRMTATLNNSTTGTTVLENLTTGKSAIKTFSGKAASMNSAEWILEDFSFLGAQLPFADFGTIVFANASATSAAGTTGPGNATILNLKQGGRVFTKCDSTLSSVSCAYVTLH